MQNNKYWRDCEESGSLNDLVQAECKIWQLLWKTVWYFLKKLNTELPAILLRCMDFPGGSEVKNLLTMQETWVRSLGQEDPLEKEMATHSSILAWKIRWTEEPVGLQSVGLQRVGHGRVTKHTQVIYSAPRVKPE